MASLEEIARGRVLMRGRATARGRVSGVELDAVVWALWEWREGKLFRGTAFRSEEEALAGGAEG